MKFLTPALTPDGAGGDAVAWSIAYRARAKVEETKGKEILFADGRKSAITHIITLRRGPWVNTLPKLMDANSCRILYQGKTLRVKAPPVNVEGEGIVYQLHCIEYGTDQ